VSGEEAEEAEAGACLQLKWKVEEPQEVQRGHDRAGLEG
jgi:hypothetical protein